MRQTGGGDRRSPRPGRLRLSLWAGIATLGVVVLAVAAAVVAPRLSPSERVCPAIGYSSVLEVSLTGDTSRVAHLQVRDGDVWQPPLPADSDAPALQTSRDGDTRAFTLFFPPRPIQLRVVGEDGEVLARTEVDVTWERVGGTPECGGPTIGRTQWAL